jgi:hypothetical protein
VEPLHPDLRQALKRAHPGLTDDDINRFEELLARVLSLDPATESDTISRLSGERDDMLRRLMPHYARVAQAFAAERRSGEGAERRGVRTRIKPPEP